jgi:hypothetical protein
MVEPEVWNENALRDYIQSYKNCYSKGDEFFKSWAWKDINSLMDQVLSGEIVVKTS